MKKRCTQEVHESPIATPPSPRSVEGRGADRSAVHPSAGVGPPANGRSLIVVIRLGPVNGELSCQAKPFCSLARLSFMTNLLAFLI